MYYKSKVLVATLTHTTLYTFASDVARSCKIIIIAKLGHMQKLIQGTDKTELKTHHTQ